MSGHFDGFVIRVSDQQSDTLEFKLPAEARNFTIPNLTDDTAYDIELYGISYGRRTASVLAHAVTGTAYFTCIFSAFPAVLLLHLESYRFFPKIRSATQPPTEVDQQIRIRCLV